jgi:hypothetical protein
MCSLTRICSFSQGEWERVLGMVLAEVTALRQTGKFFSLHLERVRTRVRALAANMFCVCTNLTPLLPSVPPLVHEHAYLFYVHTCA